MLAGILLILLGACDRDPPPDESTAGQVAARAESKEAAATAQDNAAGSNADGFAGASVCATCHLEEAEAWRGSHHDLAMAVADADSVLGDFEDTAFEIAGEQSRFFRRDGGWWIATTGEDGATAEYEVAYTFGADPLQQYLVEFPDGRLQAYGVAWDTRAPEEGGQRWFHVYGDDPPVAGESIHWTGIDQNWNYMCADCHSTGYRKNYDPGANTYASTYTDIDVACEACHGPGAAHAEWAEAGAGGADPGFVVRLSQEGRRRVSVPDAPTVKIEGPVNRTEVEACGRCHARRTTLREPYAHGEVLADSFMPALLTEPLYHPDGQIRDEVYVYGSFRQSRMYAAGVSCGDCHEPHSLELRAEGDGVCAQCHQPAHFAAAEHTFHEPGPDAPGCRDCHMPEQDYMVVDPRRDHSFRVPRPDLAASLGVTNACADCHADKSPQWSAEAVRRWLGRDARGEQDFAVAFRRAGDGWPDAAPDLMAIVDDDARAAIVRATALTHLARFPSRDTFTRVAANAYDEDALVRLGTVNASEGFSPDTRRTLLEPLLSDPVLAVRAEAARVLAGADPAAFSDAGRSALSAALSDYVQTQRQNADRPEARMNLGNLYAEARDAATAEQQYRAALALDPGFAPAWTNLADLQRATGDEAGAEATLREGLDLVRDPASLEHSLGLLLVRVGRPEEALEWLSQATLSEPGNARFAYVYGVALHDLGRPDDGIQALEAAHSARPSDANVLAALVVFCRDDGRMEDARRFADRLVELQPDNPEALALRDGLEEF